jgi:hypothetical protein
MWRSLLPAVIRPGCPARAGTDQSIAPIKDRGVRAMSGSHLYGAG